MSQHVVQVGVWWQDVEPSGEPCKACGDRCYLREVRPFYRVCGEAKQLCDIVLCGSCADVVLDATE